MQRPHKTLPFARVDPSSTCVSPDRGYTNLTLEHPAIAVMTDFRHTPAFTASADTPIEHALGKMKTVGVRMLLVADSDGLLHGIVTANDILGERAIEFMEANRVKREEVRVEDIMHEHDMLYAFKLNDVLNATIGDLVATLRHYGFQHVLVTTIDHNEPKVRGIFSAADIARLLKVNFDPMTRANSFAELGKALIPSAAA
ncbi:CBS domain-containing protein [Chitinivorax sp. PXF-14]|uniref:CBS domain-containing protein n=1 Tax=Chitinivorax sp. PXF-14 TaxID=3230488 RepID=UPI0034656415